MTAAKITKEPQFKLRLFCFSRMKSIYAVSHWDPEETQKRKLHLG